jgi:hypothetical protein
MTHSLTRSVYQFSSQGLFASEEIGDIGYLKFQARKRSVQPDSCNRDRRRIQRALLPLAPLKINIPILRTSIPMEIEMALTAFISALIL